LLKTLHGKLALALGAILFLVALLLLPLTLYVTRLNRQEVNQRLFRNLAATVAQEKDLVRDGQVSPEIMDKVIALLERLNPGIEAYALDTTGHVLAYRASDPPLETETVDLKPIHEFLRGGKLPIIGEDPRDMSHRRAFSVAELHSHGPKSKLDGYIYIVLDSQEYDSAASMFGRSYALRLRIAATIAVLFCALAMGVVVFNQLTRRLTRLSQAMEAFQQNDFHGGTQINPGDARGDEIDRLTAIFSGMSGRIEQQIQELRKADAERREMVSNASHDLRTPLAALRGYLETILLREGRMTPAEQRAYLSIAIKHGERLGALVDELFELTKLDAPNVEARMEPFHIGELLQDITYKYQLVAENKGVKLTSEMTPGLPFVLADIGMIERVLENLIENALRHTLSGGSVKLRLQLVNDRVQVQIADTGSGIAAEDIDRIFDRFYRAPANVSSSSGKSGAGLGLAIVKRILELHGSSIDVHSRPNEGAVFTFDLPAYTPPEASAEELYRSGNP
jgi:two-component system OmpR family sensor kinase